MHAAWRDEWDGLERITRDLRAADLFTLLNGLLGLAAIVAAVDGHVLLAVHLVLVGVLADGIDGAVARLGHGGGPLGATLDTLADTVSFVAAPAIIAAASVEFRSWLLAPIAFFALCGLLRLARFEALRAERPRQYFSGLSTPGAALTLLSPVLVGAQDVWLLAAAAVLGALMVSRFRYPKLRGLLGAWAGLSILVVIVTAWGPWQAPATWAMLAFMALYVLAGPFYVLTRHGPVEAA